MSPLKSQRELGGSLITTIASLPDLKSFEFSHNTISVCTFGIQILNWVSPYRNIQQINIYLLYNTRTNMSRNRDKQLQLLLPQAPHVSKYALSKLPTSSLLCCREQQQRRKGTCFNVCFIYISVVKLKAQSSLLSSWS